MAEVLDQFLHPGYVYKFMAGPDTIRTRDEALQWGINCVSLAHLVLRKLTDYRLPPDLRCYEMFRDTVRFEDVTTEDNLRLGDLVWLGEKDPTVPIDQFVPRYDETGYMLNWSDCGLNHLAIATGQAVDGDPLLLHASPDEGTNVLWPLSRFSKYPRYESVYRVARLAVEPNVELSEPACVIMQQE